MDNTNEQTKKIMRKGGSFLSVVKFSFEIITLLSTIISVWLVFLTLEEMQIERNNSYRPNLCCIEQTYLVEINPERRFGEYHNEASVVDVVNYGEDRSFSVDFVNIGVGAMENINIIVSQEECLGVIDQFNQLLKYSEVGYGDRALNVHNADYVEFSDGTQWEFFRLDEDTFVPYVLANAEQTVSCKLPSVYSCMIYAAIIEIEEMGYDATLEYLRIPDISLMIEYTDVQGVRYQEESIIKTQLEWLFGYGFLVNVSIYPA